MEASPRSLTSYTLGPLDQKFSWEQLSELEAYFKVEPYPDLQDRKIMATRLKLKEEQVEVRLPSPTLYASKSVFSTLRTHWGQKTHSQRLPCRYSAFQILTLGFITVTKRQLGNRNKSYFVVGGHIGAFWKEDTDRLPPMRKQCGSSLRQQFSSCGYPTHWFWDEQILPRGQTRPTEYRDIHTIAIHNSSKITLMK